MGMPRPPWPRPATLRLPKTRTFYSVEHLNPEAIAAFVDNELAAEPAHRARVHIAHCAECRQEVQAQRKASQLLQRSNRAETLRAPEELMQRLQGIARGCAPGPDADSVPMSKPEDFGDRIELAMRAWRKLRAAAHPKGTAGDAKGAAGHPRRAASDSQSAADYRKHA